MAYLTAGENKLAMELLEHLLNDFQSLDKTGVEDISTHERILLDSLAKSYMRSVELEKAALTFERSLPMYIESLGESHPDTIQTAIFISMIHNSLGNTERSEQLIQRFDLEANKSAEYSN